MGSFKDIIGHEREIGILKSAVVSGRMSHAYIFYGPGGIGKKLVAHTFANALNCSSPEDGDLCGICTDCLAGFRANVLEVNPTVEVKKDVFEDDEENGLVRVHQVREVQSALRYRVERGKKVVIVNSADKFMPQAGNAFLKTLEEPPPDSIIILITSRPSALLPTILSRCAKLGFRALSNTAVASWLSQTKGLSENDAVLAGKLGDGSLAMSLRYCDEGLAEKRRTAAENLKNLALGNTLTALALAESLCKRDDLEDMLEFFKMLCRDRLAGLLGMGALAVNSNITEFSNYDAGQKDSAYRALLEAYALIEKTRFETTPPRFGNKLLALERLFLRLARNKAFA
ncbi:DNA polymerase III subunit delta' [bacterium]|nr:MAG: DNA polymerase III subunit delta' [bacterium]